jgi:hypothetical protein
MRTRVRVAVVAMLAVPALASAGPHYVLGLGGSGGATEGLDGPGFAANVSALWRVEPWLQAGPMLFWDDQGTTLGRLLDPNDGTDLGTTPTDHRMVFGGAWRADVPFRIGTGPWGGYAGGTLGYYRIHDDQAGIVEQAFSATGASAAVGIQRRVGPVSELGLSFRYHRVFDERLDYYWSATLDWTLSSGAQGTPVKTTAPAGGK